MKKAFIITVSILSCIVLVLGLTLFSTTSTLNSTSANLENVYQRSFYDLVNNVNNMEVEVSKLLVSNDSTSQQKILSNIKEQTGEAENSLSLLPVNANVVYETSKFMNKLNGYCSSLITYNDGVISENDIETLESVHSSINNIKIELNKIIEKIMNGYRISDNLGMDGEINNFSSNFTSFTTDTMQFPSLIYDGPFSDSTINKTVKGLKDFEVTEDEAKEYVESIFSDATDIVYLGKASGRFETYDFTLNSNNRMYYIQITKKGKFLLTMSANVSSGNEDTNSSSSEIEKNSTESDESVDMDDVNDKSEELLSAITQAKDFAKSLDILDMECVWSAKTEKTAYINLAPVVDDIIMYPDLIKVKVDLNSNTIIGWEASSYAYNHVEREDLIAQLTESEARELISKNLEVESQKLCVIPLDFVGETLAYEFSGEYYGYRYYLYIDAYTGKQVRVLRVVQTNEGELVL